MELNCIYCVYTVRAVIKSQIELNMLLNLTNFSSEPIHQQIVGQILDRIIDNEMQSGDELVSIGKLSRQQHVGKTTVTKAYKELERMKIIRSISEEKYIINNLTQKELVAYSKVKSEDKKSISEKERLNAELEAARQIQSDMLPKQLPDNEKISVAAYSTISNEVGGDFYDFFEIRQNQFGVLIGDASGKGLPAALLISQIQAIIKSDISHRRSIKQTFDLLNTYLKINSSAKSFATLFYGILNIDTGKIKYANAGHNFPMIIKNHGGTEVLKTTGPALGIMVDAEYSEKTTMMNESDIMILFTDGVPETMNSNNIQYSENRIHEYCQTNRNRSAKELILGVKNELNSFRSLKSENDDTTFMVIKKHETLKYQ